MAASIRTRGSGLSERPTAGLSLAHGWPGRALDQHRCLNLQINADDLFPATCFSELGALAELRELQMSFPAEFYPRGDKQAVDLHAQMPLELKQEIDQPRVRRAAAQH